MATILTLSSNKHKVVVNGDLVLYVLRDNPDYTSIYFSEEDQVDVVESLDTVYRLLWPTKDPRKKPTAHPPASGSPSGTRP